jgi:hypothetical protein
LALAAVLGQLGCSSSSDTGSSPATDAAGNDATRGDDGGGTEAGASEGGAAGMDGGDATVATSMDGGDATVATSTDGATDSSASSLVDSGHEASTAAWSPSSLSGLVLWLEGNEGLGATDAGSDAGDGGPGVLWVDQSGLGNDAVGYGPAINPSALDGQPAVHFNGADYLLVQDSPSLNWNTQDFVLAMVVQHTTYLDGGPPVYGTLYSKQIYDTAPYVGVGLFGNSPGGASSILAQLSENSPSELTSGGTGYNSGAPFLVVLHRTGAWDGGASAEAGGPAMAMLINAADAGYATGQGWAQNVDSNGYPLRIGGTQAAQDLVGDIAEVIAISGPVAPSDLENLQSYLMSKYGL